MPQQKRHITVVPHPHNVDEQEPVVDVNNPRLIAATRLLIDWMLSTLKEDDAMSNVHASRETDREEETMINIRALRESDHTEWMRLRFALWPDYTVEDMQKEMAGVWADQEHQPVFVAERPDGRLCGLMEVAIHSNAPGCTTDKIGYLEGWYVDADMRGQGLGGRLVETAENWARSQGCCEMASDTEAEYPTSPAAHAALGYQTVEWYFRKDL